MSKPRGLLSPVTSSAASSSRTSSKPTVQASRISSIEEMTREPLLDSLIDPELPQFTFKKYISDLLSALLTGKSTNIGDEEVKTNIDEITQKIVKAYSHEQYKIMNITGEKVNTLLFASEKLHKLYARIPENAKAQWKKLLYSLAYLKLQIFIRPKLAQVPKVVQTQPEEMKTTIPTVATLPKDDTIVDDLLKVITEQIDAVNVAINTINKAELAKKQKYLNNGSQENNFKKKYLKYKQKYLQLKSMIKE
jgi:hypothetical protein